MCNDDKYDFQKQISKYGTDDISNSIREDDTTAYIIAENCPQSLIILTDMYPILPDKDVFLMSDIIEYGLAYENNNPDFAQYAEDRMGMPYDPNFVSEYEGEETFELDRFSVLLVIKDSVGIISQYTIYLDVNDRTDFLDILSSKTQGFAYDISDTLAVEGKFDDNNYSGW